MPMETPMTTTAWMHERRHDFVMPVPISHHFQGSVKIIKYGIQAASSVVPEEIA
jgi:hypothetical protein